LPRREMASSPTAGETGSSGAAGPGDENILDDLLTQNNDHETMFEEDDDDHRKEEELLADDDENDGGGGGDAAVALNDDHSDISDAESHHDDDEEVGKDEFDGAVKGAEDISDNESDGKAGNESLGGDAKEDAAEARNERDAEEEDISEEESPKPREKIRAPSPTLAALKSHLSTLKTAESKEAAPVKMEEKEGDATTKKKSKQYDYVTKLNYLFRDARFFLVKSNNAENVTLSKAKGVWSTPPANETRLNQAFREARNVLLIYSVKESGRFAGFARLASESRRDVPSVPWVLPHGLSAKALGGVFKIDWICRKDLSFSKVIHLNNPWNDNKPVKIGRDGQEIEPRVAEEICRQFPEDGQVEMTPILRRSKESARQQRAKPESERRKAVPTTKPLSVNRGGPPRDSRGPPPMRKRRSDHDEYYQTGRGGKYSRGTSSYAGREYGTVGYAAAASRSSSRRYEEYDYEEYRDDYRQEYRQPASSGGSSSRSYYAAVRDHYDRDPYLYDDRDPYASSSSTRYDRSVDEFLRRNDRERDVDYYYEERAYSNSSARYRERR